ncbi:hypothetical protein [Ideonella paludis]|uniref:hypothetical protein n=1 Tax=Ideonella paludis TaxID=1233411 RepID=UPI00363E6ABE
MSTTSVLLHAVVVSHFLDVERFKEFHCEPKDAGEEARISYPKIAAFMIKWVAKIRPFRVELDPNSGEKITAVEWDFYSVQINALIAPILYAMITNQPPFEDYRIIHELQFGNLGTDALVLLLER